MQERPLLEKLDSFFSSASWMTYFPTPNAIPRAKSISNHLACVIQIGTGIPKARDLRFENFWLQHASFNEVVQNGWAIPMGSEDFVKTLIAKVKM